ncbi:hypothetical protein K3495_g7013 [Podosphaera aphanis]|nr:hypothetical protein K3495_g7013 [Podosphaera aphanis]
MSQTSAFDIRNSQKLRTATKKYERPEPEPNPSADVPASRLNIFERMDIAGNSSHDNSIHAIIDVIPDNRYILLFIVYHVKKLYMDKEQNTHPCLTPSSFTVYCLFLTYGFFLVNDYHGRPSPSYYASSFMDSDARAQLFEHLKKAYVPPFMMTLFHGLTDTSDPRRPGLQYFPTFAGSCFCTDFGRIIPPQIFLASHNISAEQDTSRPGINAMNTLMATIIFSSNINATTDYYAGDKETRPPMADDKATVETKKVRNLEIRAHDKKNNSALAAILAGVSTELHRIVASFVPQEESARLA